MLDKGGSKRGNMELKTGGMGYVENVDGGLEKSE